MKNSWGHLFRRLAAGCIISGSAAWSSAMCYATVAMDNASDPVYADGWQDGDNGGFGFTPWDFYSVLTFNGMRYAYANTDFHAIDDGLQNGTHYSNPFNNIGRAWDLGAAPPPAPPAKSGVPRAGRGFSLGIGETLKVVFDNPTKRKFFKGYQINLNGGTGGVNGNICYGTVECVAGSAAVRKTGLTTFEYFSYGEWGLHDGDVDGNGMGGVDTSTGVFDTDTAAAGAVFTVKRTGTETYEATLDSLGGSTDFGPASRTFSSAGSEVDWIEFTFFNTVTEIPQPPPGDYNNSGRVDAADYVLWRNGGPLQNDPTEGVQPADYDFWRARFGNLATGSATDFYIRSIEIFSGTPPGAAATVPEPGTLVLLVVGSVGVVTIGLRRKPTNRRE